MNNYDLSTTEDIILVTVTKIPTDNGFLAEIINLLCSYNIAIDIMSLPSVLGKGECITFTVSDSDIDKLLKVSTELKKYYSGIGFSISCTNVKFTFSSISADLTHLLFSKIVTLIKQADIPTRFVSCSVHEFLIITDILYSEHIKELIGFYM